VGACLYLVLVLPCLGRSERGGGGGGGGTPARKPTHPPIPPTHPDEFAVTSCGELAGALGSIQSRPRAAIINLNCATTYDCTSLAVSGTFNGFTVTINGGAADGTGCRAKLTTKDTTGDEAKKYLFNGVGATLNLVGLDIELGGNRAGISAAGGSVSLKGVSISGGVGQSTSTSMMSVSAAGGGAVKATGGAVVTVSGGVFFNNLDSIQGLGSVFGLGGAIAVANPKPAKADKKVYLTVTGATFLSNTSPNGGAIGLFNSRAAISGCTFDTNTAYGQGGGAVYSETEEDDKLKNPVVSIKSSNFVNNQVMLMYRLQSNLLDDVCKWTGDDCISHPTALNR
jgi:hypothetical protein